MLGTGIRFLWPREGTILRLTNALKHKEYESNIPVTEQLVLEDNLNIILRNFGYISVYIQLEKHSESVKCKPFMAPRQWV